MFAFCFVAIGSFWANYNEFDIWSWKFKVKVMANVKSYVWISGLESNRYACFLLRGNRTIFDRDIVNSIFDLENSRSRSQPRSSPMVEFSRLVCFLFHCNRTILAEIKWIPNLTAAAYELVQKPGCIDIDKKKISKTGSVSVISVVPGIGDPYHKDTMVGRLSNSNRYLGPRCWEKDQVYGDRTDNINWIFAAHYFNVCARPRFGGKWAKRWSWKA